MKSTHCQSTKCLHVAVMLKRWTSHVQVVALCKWMRPNSALESSKKWVHLSCLSLRKLALTVGRSNLPTMIIVNLRCFDCLVVECDVSSFTHGIYTYTYQCITQLQPNTVHMLLDCIPYLTWFSMHSSGSAFQSSLGDLFLDPTTHDQGKVTHDHKLAHTWPYIPSLHQHQFDISRSC